MKTVKIELIGNEIELSAGLTKASDLYEKIGLDASGKWLYLGRDNDIDIPLVPDDYIVIHGGERIFSGDINQQIGENPSVRHPLHPTFNDKQSEKDCDKAKITGRELREWDDELSSSKLFVDLQDQVDAFVADDWRLVLQDADCYFTIPAGDDDVVDLEACARAKRKPPKGQNGYSIKIDGEKFKVETQQMMGKDILALVDKEYGEWFLIQKFSGGRRVAVEHDKTVDFSSPGIERFETVKRQAQQG